jgi:pimeloyl-ACP methyl ester carboxylesterase
VSDAATVSPASGTAVNFTGTVTYTVTAKNGSTQAYTVTVNAPNPCANNCNSSVLFFPGIEGSLLYERPTALPLWLPQGISAQTLRLLQDPLGNSIHDVYANGIIGTAYVTGLGDIYKSFLQQLNDMKNTDALIADWRAISYDWRLPPDKIVRNATKIGGTDEQPDLSYLLQPTSSSGYIIEELRRLAQGSRTGKVTIVAHSYGGLVTKRLTQILGPEAPKLIDKIIFVAVPQAGTPTAIGGLLHGFGLGIKKPILGTKISDQTARTLAQNMPMAYNLLPSEQYFTYVDDPVITFDDSALLAPWRARYGTAIHSRELLHTFLVDQERNGLLPASAYENALMKPTVSNESLLLAAEFLHHNPPNTAAPHTTGIDHWGPPPGIALTEIAGWGLETVKGIEYNEGKHASCTNTRIKECKYISVLQYKPLLVTADGDGTVVVPSALWTPQSAGVKKFWLNLSHYGSRGHGNIFESDQLREFIQDIITGDTAQLPFFVSTVSPVAPYYPTRLRFTLHSPLSLDLYDENGNHTGISKTTGELEENIPGSSYNTFGEVKYISVPASLSTHLVMHGTASGSFTLEIEEVSGDTVTDATTFVAIPSSVDTVVTMDIPGNAGIEGASPLMIDENDDGTPEFQLEPGGTVSDTVPPLTTASINGTKGTNGWYTSDVTVALSSVDNPGGAGVAATRYSLDSGATWQIYGAAEPIRISKEGIHTLQYQSVDFLGNSETAVATIINIDKTAPEGKITLDPVTRKLTVIGSDNLSQTTVESTPTSSLITDKAGHILKITFSDFKQQGFGATVRVTGLAYDGVPVKALPISRLMYLWTEKKDVISNLIERATITRHSHGAGLYDAKKNSTVILTESPVSDNDEDREPNDRKAKKETLSGLRIFWLSTKKGVMSVGY